jgi:hypothetical protein
MHHVPSLFAVLKTWHSIWHVVVTQSALVEWVFACGKWEQELVDRAIVLVECSLMLFHIWIPIEPKISQSVEGLMQAMESNPSS